jgi:hypothetical protein
MPLNSIPLIAQSGIRTFYENVPLLPLTQWWHGLLVFGFAVLLLVYIIWMYRKDTVELPRGLAVLLATLRILAFTGLFLFFLNPEKRSETEIVKPSRVAVLIDTSASMGLTDPSENTKPTDQLPRRIDQVISTLKNSDLIGRLSKRHDVTAYRFAEGSQPEATTTFSRQGSDRSAAGDETRQREEFQNTLAISRKIAIAALVCFIVSIVLFIPVLILLGNAELRETRAWILAASLLCFVASVCCVGVADLVSNQVDMWTSLGLKTSDASAGEMRQAKLEEQNDSAPVDPDSVDWADKLSPSGTATRLGDTIQYIINQERGGPIAGIVLVTDGRNNIGLDPQRALSSAVDAGIPIYSIGVGSDREVQNVKVADIQAPPRAFPNDKFKIKGIVQATGMAGQIVNVKLVSTDTEGKEAELEEASTDISLGSDNQPVPVEFEVLRQEEGKRKYILRVKPQQLDLDSSDNQRTSIVEIIQRRSKVLMVVGGPNRDYRFLRNQLYRDENVELHIWLQSAKPGADQESDKMLTEFPGNREDMYQYDCIVAFDPDWAQLDEMQVTLLEKWVAEQAGGMIIVAGAVNTPEWTRAPRGDDVIDVIRRLYPVSFYSQSSARTKLGRFGGTEAFQLDFTREGRAAEFLWLGDNATESQENWDRWEGVYGFYAVNEAKAGASVLAYFSDPSTSINDTLPIYLASQFYGAGRVFFQASGELWRLREVEVDFFQDYYTQLIRWASQGRLLRDSTRGVLLTDRDRAWVGDQVSVRAILRDDQDQPLALNQVNATLLEPSGTTKTLTLRSADQAIRPGTFTGNFLVPKKGDYRISLTIPGSADLETLTKTIESSIPDRENEQPQLNVALLTELAEKSNGYYFNSLNNATAPEGQWIKIEAMIQAQDQKSYLPGTPDREFTKRLMQWLLILITLALAVEWTCRRLHKLA